MRLEAGNFESQVSPIPIYNADSIGTSDLTSRATTRVIWSDPAFPVPPALTYTDLDVPVGSTIGIMLYT
jgi:hypothetical protein